MVLDFHCIYLTNRWENYSIKETYAWRSENMNTKLSYIDPIHMTPHTRLKCFMNTKMNINTTRKRNINVCKKQCEFSRFICVNRMNFLSCTHKPTGWFFRVHEGLSIDYAPAWVEKLALPKALSIDGRGPRWSCNAFDLHRDVDGSFLPLRHFFDAPPKQRK